MANYLNTIKVGLDQTVCLGDGYTVLVKWFKAYPTIKTNKIAYHIYYSTIKEDVFYEGPKYLSIDDSLEANVIDLIPGQQYFFSIRPIEYLPSVDLSVFPIAYDNLRFYNTTLLSSNITDTDLTIPLIDSDGFPNTGVIKVGAELIEYNSVSSNDLILNDINGRGAFNTIARSHTTDGYDGYHSFNPNISLYVFGEQNIFDRIFACQNRFEYPNYAFTTADGYHQITKDLLSTDLSASDEFNTGFPTYNYSGYHRTDPVNLLNGTCIGSYIGGETLCVDKYGVGQPMRGLSLQDKNNQRQEMLLEVTGRPAVLIKRIHTGITCSCFTAENEYPDDRCDKCLGTKFVFGYEQFFNPRRSDGRILVRCGPADENLKMNDSGLESELPLDLWTITVPTIKTRDIIILFSMDNNEEFRYEVNAVARNNTILGLEGGQKFKATRIRKTDPAYQFRVFRDTSTIPVKLNTSIAFSNGILPHVHEYVGNQTSSSNWSQVTSISQGHSHTIIFQNNQLVVLEAVGHTHIIV